MGSRLSEFDTIMAARRQDAVTVTTRSLGPGVSLMRVAGRGHAIECEFSHDGGAETYGRAHEDRLVALIAEHAATAPPVRS